MSLSLVVDLRDLERLNKRLENIASADTGPFLDSVGNILVDSAKVRIEDTNETPDGEPWPEWSAAYAATRNSGQGLLFGEGDLHGSITHEVDGDVVRIGSNLVYAGVHDQGWDKRNIPARTYLGISVDDEEAIGEEIDAWFEELLL